MSESDPATHKDSDAGAAPESEPAEFRSEELLRGRREVIIVHNDERYRLMVTRNAKLILQK